MAISSSDFLVNVSPNPMGVVVGGNGDLRISFSNTNLVDRAYNLSLAMTLPDGVSFLTSSVNPNSIVTNPSGTITITWTNIKDLAPNELDYIVDVQLKADENFRSTGSSVPFDIPLISINISGKVDTLPRGNEDLGNVEIIKTSNINFIPLRYNVKKFAPGKVAKGAGSITPSQNPLWIYEYKIVVENNTRLPSTVTLLDNLPNGVRYLNDLSVSGPDELELLNPIITTPSPGPGCQDNTTIDWGTVTLSSGSINTITFNSAIWNNYTSGCIENNGDKIPHNAPLLNTVTLNGLSGAVTSNTTTLAKDALINKSSNLSIGDVGTTVIYTLNYRINQYDDVSSFIITDTIPNGQSYITGSASITPISVVTNADGTTTIIWNLSLKEKGSSGNITFNALIDTDYISTEPVSADDIFVNNVDINGTNITTFTATPDSSSASVSIKTPKITKSILGYYYKDGSLKSTNIVAPGDLVEFLIAYDSLGILAVQKSIEIDEYPPLNMGPLQDSIPVTYGGTFTGSFTPVTVSPNGLRWNLGNIPSNKTWTANFKIPVGNIDYVGTRNNLAKLYGQNTDSIGYSDRSLVPVTFGAPNVAFNKTVTGPNVNAIKSGETYTFTINISNMQNTEGTVVDAFQMDLQDIIPTGLSYISGSALVSGTGTATNPSVVGQNLTMTIIKLPPNGNLNLTFDVTVDNTLVSGSILTNTATLQPPYSQNDRSYQYPTSVLTSHVTLRAKGVTLSKLVTPNSVKIGDKVTYVLTATVPEGTIAYNLKVIDNYTSSTQTYIGNATRDGLSVTPTTPPPAGTVTFPTETTVNALLAPVTITYSFDTRVIGGTHNSPFIENQINNATVYWDLTPLGPAAIPFSTSTPLEVRTPNILRTKNQRNVSIGGNFTSGTINYDVGDIIEYRLTVTNNGAETAYNTVVTDNINSFLSAPFSISATAGTFSYAAPNLVWTIPEISAGGTASLIFRVTTLSGIGSNGTVTNTFSAVYKTNDNGFEISYGPVSSNTVILRSPKATISKTSDIDTAQIGDDIEYTLNIKIPKGTILYNVTIDDLIPANQSYIGPATLLVTPGGGPPINITTSLSPPYTVFNLPTLIPYIPNPTTIDASASVTDVRIKIKFIARVITGTHSGTFTEIQTNTGRIRWAVTSGGTVNISSASNMNITVTTPNIVVTKQQSIDNINYTDNTIQNVQQTDTVYYKLTVLSNGAATAENIRITDNINSNLVYSGAIGSYLGSVSFVGGILTWDGFSLPIGNTATLVIAFTIVNPVPANSIINNLATALYDSNDVNPITYNTSSNNTNLIIGRLIISKVTSPIVAAVGDIITHTITVTVPEGMIAYNIEVNDVLPPGQQYYAPGTPPPTSATPNSVIFVDTVPSRTGLQTLTYSFDAIVVSGNTNTPYTQIQQNTAEVNWRLSDGGVLAPPSSTTFSITATNPHIKVLKTQRNVTNGGVFTTDTITVSGGDQIQYELQITNDGVSTAYNVETTDLISSALTNITAIGSGIINIVGNNVTWTISSILPGNTETLLITADATPGASGALVTNKFSTIYKSNPTLSTNLGPVNSNEITFNYTLPQINKTVSNFSVFSGSRITYTVEVTVPSGIIIYNAQFIDTLPLGQSYLIGSAKEDGLSVTPIQLGNELTFPSKAIIDASLGEVTIVYTFDVDVTSTVAQSVQTNTGKLNWDLTATGPAGPEINDTEIVYVTNSDIQISKAQRNFTVDGVGPPYFATPLIAELGDIILYELVVTNLSSNTIFNVQVVDILDSSLSYVIFGIPPTSGTIFENLGVITWNIPSLPSLGTARAVIAAQVTGNFVNGLIKNFAEASFSASDTSPMIIYGPRESNEVILNYPSLTINKTVSKSIVEVGEIITYYIDITIPPGAVIYDLRLIDTLPPGQIYGGESTKNSVSVFPTISGQDVIFDIEPTIIANPNSVTINYTIKARVVDGNFSAPYTEIQTNNAQIFWNIDPLGTPAVPISNSENIQVNTADLFIAKSQRNDTTGTSFTTDTIFVNKNDVIEYRLVAHNFGVANAYNVVLEDELEPNQNFLSFVNVPIGTTATLIGNIVIFTIPVLAPNEVLSIVFSVKESGELPAGGTEINIGEGGYDTTEVTPIEKDGFLSNKVFHQYPSVEIYKTGNLNTARVGDKIRYTVQITVPFGTTAYNLSLTDVLPIGQNYIGNATLNGIEVIGNATGLQIQFPPIPFVDANTEAKVFIYEFDALIESVIVNPTTFIENQLNEGVINWYFDPQLQRPANSINTIYGVVVTNSNVKIEKLQRNVTEGGAFTKNNIVAYADQFVEYKFIITNTGENTVYSINITDLLDINLSFIEEVHVPVGTLNYASQTVNYALDSLVKGEYVEVVFKVKVLETDVLTIDNYAFGIFKSTQSGTDIFKIDNSNTVTLDTIDVNKKNLIITKYQRNISKGEKFTGNIIEAYGNDIIEYKLVIHNALPRKLYDIKLEDNLSESLAFVKIQSVPKGLLTHTGEDQNGTVNYTLNMIEGNETIEVIFQVKVLVSPLSNINNFAQGTFSLVPYGTIITAGASNIVTIKNNLESVCLITDKIFSQCQKRICIDGIKVSDEGTIEKFIFSNGIIEKGTLVVEPLLERPSFAKVEFKLNIPYKVTINKNGIIEEIDGVVKDIQIKTILFDSFTRDEVKYKIKVNTISEALRIYENEFTLGSIVVISLLYNVQLLIPAYGYCKAPCNCEEYKVEGIDMCKDFLDYRNTEFPIDFYPKDKC